MKNSCVKWIGEIPDDWSVMSVKHFFNIERGRVISVFELCDDGEFPVYSSQTENNGCLGYLKTYDYSGPAITWTTDGAKAGTVFYREGKYNCTNVCGILTFKNDNEKACNIKFMTYAIGMVAEQNKRKDINGYKIMSNEMAKIKFAVPPLVVQKAIATFLDKKCSEIDGLYSDIEKQIDVLKEYKKSIITETVTKGLNPGVKMKDSGIEWAQQIPKHWEVIPNKFVMQKEKMLCPKYAGEDILSLTMNGVIVRDLDAGGKMPASFDGYQFVYPGNLLMCLFDYDVTPRCIGLIKNYGLTSPAYSQFVMKNGNSERYYYYYYLMIDNTKELLHLAKNLRHSFTEEQLGMINTPVPPIDEQIAIADYLDKVIFEIDKVIADKKEQLEVLAEYKKSLIYEYVTGKKEVPNG